MANPNSPFGLWPAKHVSGGTPHRHNQMANWKINASDTTQIFRGSLVKRNTNGNEVTKAANTDTNLVGVFWGCRYKNSKGEIKYSAYWTGEAGATELEAQVLDDPYMQFEVQADDALAATSIGNTGNIVVGDTGDPKTGNSNAQLDTSNVGTGTQLRVLDYNQEVDNEQNSAYNRVIVVINNHALTKGT